jgi:hypothetical protein
VRAKVLAAIGGLTILAIGLVIVLNRPRTAPALTNIYAASLSAYWTEVATSVKVDPHEGRLHDWTVEYDADGTIRYQRLTFISGWQAERATWYTVSQVKGRKATLDVRRLAGRSPKDVISAVDLFRELDGVGLRRLEEHSGARPPGRITVSTIFGSIQYGANTYVIDGGQISSPPPDGITLVGGQGTLTLTTLGYSGGLKPYVFPGAVTSGM